MKKLMTLALMTLACTSVMAGEHGGGNGGDDLELALKKRALQIGYFIKSDMGSKVFKTLNSNALLDTVNALDIDVVTGNVVDKYGTLRTCINEPDRQLITCSAQKIADLGSNPDVLTATLFHEILGLMELELGYQTNVSMYPISSKILSYHQVVDGTPITEAQVKPEFFGLDNRSYGLTIENKTSKETLRMICLNNNIEIHRCRNYAVVRSAQGLQTPLVDSVISLSPEDLKKINLSELNPTDLENQLHELNRTGFYYIFMGTENDLHSMKFNQRMGTPVHYRFGVGALQSCANLYHEYQRTSCYSAISATVAPITALFVTDTVAEVGKQVGNFIVYPFKALINGIRAGALRGKIAKANKRLLVARDILNLDKDLSKVGTQRKVSDEDYQEIVRILQTAIPAAKYAK